MCQEVNAGVCYAAVVCVNMQCNACLVYYVSSVDDQQLPYDLFKVHSNPEKWYIFVILFK
jgi:hypothetical protein